MKIRRKFRALKRLEERIALAPRDAAPARGRRSGHTRPGSQNPHKGRGAK